METARRTLRAARDELDALCRKRRDRGLTPIEESTYRRLCELENVVVVDVASASSALADAVRAGRYRGFDLTIDVSGWG